MSGSKAVNSNRITGYGKREVIVLCDRCRGMWYNVHVGNEQCHEVSRKKWQLADNFFCLRSDRAKPVNEEASGFRMSTAA